MLWEDKANQSRDMPTCHRSSSGVKNIFQDEKRGFEFPSNRIIFFHYIQFTGVGRTEWKQIDKKTLPPC